MLPMYLKVSFRHNPAIMDIAAYYRLVESYRNEDDRVCHKTLLNIGFWTDAAPEQKNKVVAHLNARYKNELLLFEEADTKVVQWVNRFWNEMIKNKTIDRKEVEQRHRLLRADTISHKEAREIGTEWICANTWNHLKLTELFRQLNWPEEKIQLAMTQVIARAVYPAAYTT